MECDFERKILDLEGKPVEKLGPDGKPKEGHDPYTLKDLAVGGLQFDDMDKPKEEMQKLADFKLALRLYEGGVQTLSIDEAKRIKTVIGKVYSTLFVGRANEIMEPNKV